MKRLFFLIIFFVPVYASAFWPLMWELDGEKHFLGPIFSYKRDEKSTALTIRPLFSYDSRDGGVYRYIYPLGKSTEEFSYFVPFYMRRKEDDKGYTSIFPLFWGKSEKGEYAGIFPIYGQLYDRFNKDEMGFFLWPIYSYSETDGARKTNILWPFFAIYSGREKGMKFWPVFGYREVEGVSKSGFFLWPVFFKTERGLNTDDPIYSFYAIPFYMDAKSKKREFKSIMWPIYTKSKTEYKTELDILWPLYKKIEGDDKEGFSLFPIYTYERNDKDEKYSFLWPIYRSNEWYAVKEKNINKSFFLLNRYIEDENGKLQNIWPFFEHREKGDDYSFYFPSILPFRVEALDVMIKPLLTLYERKKTGDKVIDNFLYGLFTKEETPETWKTRFAFLFEIKKDPDGVGFEFLSGLFGVDKKRIKIFFMPIERRID
ncbi:MAG: hypothetical protein N2596_04215 [Syntrophorhabdaceae bacterium]|nr:hypothetical protein [Syntrophorhabdaceae bacterium]